MKAKRNPFSSLQDKNFDLLIIGGGATGAGIALDAASRGLQVLLVERDDFASGTSSRSTKLIHGGVRYLEIAVKKFDRGQFALVRDALKERSLLLKLAPHLAQALPLVTPLYSWLGIPYYRAGLKMYDWLAGKQNLAPSKYLSREAALKSFPMLKSKGLRGGVLYYDGQFDDARMNVSLALTAQDHGAIVLNHVELVAFKKSHGKLRGATLRNTLNGETTEVRARGVINATGPFCDAVRKIDDPTVSPMLKASSGIHIVLSKKFSPPDTGLLIPRTEDDRVLFLLPWLGHTLVGTTDNPANIEAHPRPQEEDIQYILRHLRKYFDMPVARSDVLAAWSGLRPLVSNPKASDTARLSRDHIVHVSESGLITVTGGKWTTYRKMALDAVDHAVHILDLHPPKPSRTQDIPLRGATGYHPQLWQELVQQYPISEAVARHLTRAYGHHSLDVARWMTLGYDKQLHPQHPYLEAEVVYAIDAEMARTAVDVLARRMRLTFLDANAARQALPRVLDLMAKQLGWNAEQRALEEKRFFNYLGHAPFEPLEDPAQKIA